MDWHNTLELNDQVPPTHDKALDALLEKADVYMLSFCGKDKKERALTYMHSLRQSQEKWQGWQICMGHFWGG